jgi:hypothetical protein
MTCLGFHEVLRVMTKPLQYLAIFMILIPLYMHERFSTMNYIFYGILICFFTIVLFLLMRSVFLITDQGLNPNFATNLVPDKIMQKVPNFPIFTNILYTQDAVMPIFANAREHTADYKVGLLRRCIFSYTSIALGFGVICYMAGFGQNEDWMFQLEIGNKFLRVFYYSMLCCLGLCFLLYNGFVVQIFFQVNAPNITLNRKRICSFGLLLVVLAFSYLLGDLQHFFALDALFNEAILGFFVPMYILYDSAKSLTKKSGLLLLIVVNIAVHIIAVAKRLEGLF